MTSATKLNLYEMAQRMMDERGYLVIGTDEPEKVGSAGSIHTQTRWGEFSTDYKIIAETDQADADIQDDLLGLPHGRMSYHYRVIAE